MTTNIRADLVGSDTCTAAGITVRANAPVLELCRHLVAAGHDPATRLEAYRGDTLCLTVRTIGEGAALAVRDDHRGSPRFVSYRPGPAKRARTAAGQVAPIAQTDQAAE